MSGQDAGRSVYDLVGGMPTFTRLAEAFYRRVEVDVLLRPMYPNDIWGPHRSPDGAIDARSGATDRSAATADDSAAAGDSDASPRELASPVDKLAAFLAQFFGGPRTYSDQRGHPRLKMRHVQFKIGQAERDAWLSHMCAAVDEVGIQEPIASVMRQYFDQTSTFLINS